MPGPRPKSTWSSLDRPTRTTTRAQAREIQRILWPARSSCSSQADAPANKKPTADMGFIATGPGKTRPKTPTSSVQPAKTTQPTSMATRDEARENVFRKATRPGMESPPSPGRPAAPFTCLAISYSRCRLLSTTTGCHCTCKVSACQHLSISASQHLSTLRPYGLRFSALQLFSPSIAKVQAPNDPGDGSQYRGISGLRTPEVSA